jgi:hypothetical protein
MIIIKKKVEGIDRKHHNEKVIFLEKQGNSVDKMD